MLPDRTLKLLDTTLVLVLIEQTGDVSQIDLPRGMPSGLIDAEQVLKGVKGIAMTRFTSVDVVRHPLVARIVEAYDAQREQLEALRKPETR